MSTRDAILQNATYHAQLLASLSELDHVPSALKEQDSRIASLEEEAGVLVRQIRALECETSKERKDLRDSMTRRLAAKFTGRKEKFEAKASKEEREYAEALEKEMQHKRQLANVETKVGEAKAVCSELHEQLKQYEQTKNDLAQLYSQIFDGPTPEYPEDDELQSQLAQAQQRHTELQESLSREAQAVELLRSAYVALYGGKIKMQEARGWKRGGAFSGACVFLSLSLSLSSILELAKPHGADMAGSDALSALSGTMERRASSAVEGYTEQAVTRVDQARSVSPLVKHVGYVTHKNVEARKVLVSSFFVLCLSFSLCLA
ncbi:hypothetical protein DFH06DRAFT_706053 [Mycena polygramma]|nr:hypothetical protein DFH06DRAFT_706053 [Mycena polygramma]